MTEIDYDELLKNFSPEDVQLAACLSTRDFSGKPAVEALAFLNEHGLLNKKNSRIVEPGSPIPDNNDDLMRDPAHDNRRGNAKRRGRSAPEARFGLLAAIGRPQRPS